MDVRYLLYLCRTFNSIILVFSNFFLMNIYVANLNFRMNDDDLREVFEGYGEVTSAKIIKDNVTGRSRGFGFVEMSSDDEANQAIKELNGAEVDGKQLTVNEARPKKTFGDRPHGGGGGGRFNNNRFNDRDRSRRF